MTTRLPPWLKELKSAIAKEFDEKPTIGVLATVDDRCAPHARTVVCRRITDDGLLCFTSDRRSDKNEHLRLDPDVEFVLWLPNLRQQFRLAGEMIVAAADSGEAIVKEIWEELPPRTRAMFSWPEPGTPRAASPLKLPEEIPAGAPIPAPFDVLVLHPRQCEHLDVTPWPHRRRRWRQEHGWEGEELNA